jgi:hypothetical protein
MTDFTTLKMQTNTGTSDASPTFTDVLFGTAANELRVCGTGAGGAATASASWPTYLRPGATGVIPELWSFTADTTGLKVTTYDGTSAHYKQFLISWDSLGTFASAPVLSAWKDNTYPAASPGTQGASDGSAVINGHATDTTSTSYLKANAYGFGYSGGQQTPASNAAGTLAVTTGTAGSVSPATSTWLATWQSLQAATQFITDGAIPTAVTAGLWYFVLSLFTGPNMTGGTLLPVLGLSYSWV